MILLYADITPACQRLKSHVNLCHASSYILSVYNQSPVALPLLFDLYQLSGRFIQADYRLVLVVRPLINTQHLFHAVPKLRTLSGRDDPLFYPPGLDLTFFKTVPTLVWEICSMTPSSTTLS